MIGTTNPGTLLEVSGSASSSGILAKYTNTYAAGSGQFAPTLWVAAPNMTAGATVEFNVGAAASTNNRANISFTYAGSGSTSNSLNFGFYGNNNKMNILANGNVGVGTTSPTSRLHVEGTVAGALEAFRSVNLDSGSTSHSLFRFFNDSGGTGAGFFMNSSARTQDAGAGGFGFYNDMGSVKFRSKNGEIGFLTGSSPTQKMTILNGGNVGIGTTSPSTPLDIVAATGSNHVLNITNTSASGGYAGSFNLNAPNLAAGETLFFNIGKSATTNNRASWTYYHQADGSGSNRLSAGFFGASNLFNILANGNVGIGYATPATRLSILGATSDSTSASLNVANVDGTSILYVRNDGNVGIGTNTPTFTLDVNGSARATGSVASWSDIRVKKNVHRLDGSLEKILKLDGVGFEWKTDEFPEKKFKRGPDIGVIAQNVETQFPEIVETDSEGYKSVAYQKLVAPLIEAVKSLFAGQKDQESRLERLDRELAALRERSERAEAENLRLKTWVCAQDPHSSLCL